MRKSEKMMKFGGMAQIAISGIIILTEILKLFDLESINLVQTPFKYFEDNPKLFLSILVILISGLEIFVGSININCCSNFKTVPLQITLNITLLFFKSLCQDIFTIITTTFTLTGALVKNRTVKKNISNNNENENTTKENS